jgi:hypothetical protein
MHTETQPNRYDELGAGTRRAVDAYINQLASHVFLGDSIAATSVRDHTYELRTHLVLASSLRGEM